MTFKGKGAPSSLQKSILSKAGITQGITFQSLPIAGVVATPKQIEILSKNKQVRSVYYNSKVSFENNENHEITGLNKLRKDRNVMKGNGGRPLSGKGIGILINDTGIDGTHKDHEFGRNLVQNVSASTNLNALHSIFPISYVENAPHTDLVSGHGTHVAGIVGGTGRMSKGLYEGVAPGADLIGYGSGDTLLDVLGGFDYAITHQYEYGIRVITNSWGNTEDIGTDFDPSHPVSVATKRAFDRGMISIFSAGNSGAEEGTITGNYKKAPWVITVTAGDHKGNLAEWSSRGTQNKGGTVEIDGETYQWTDEPTVTAPGVNIISTRSSALLSSTGINNDSQAISEGHLPYYTQKSGTSVAAPYVAGVIALVLEKSPHLLPSEVKKLIQNSATQMKGYSSWEVGAGYVNAYHAITGGKAKPIEGDKQTPKPPEPPYQAWDNVKFDRPAEYNVVTEKDVKITMTDGVILVADIHRPVPKDPNSRETKFPVIITQTPYNKNSLGAKSYFVERGYVHLVVDVRGTGGSQGAWDSWGDPEKKDGYYLVEWAARQPWSDGKVGLWGASYMAINQFFTAAQQPPSLKAIFPVVPMADSYRDIRFTGGQTNTAFIPLWLALVTSSGVRPPSYTQDDPARASTTVIGHAANTFNFPLNSVVSGLVGGDGAYDGPSYWQRSPIYEIDKVQVPAFISGGLRDIFQRGTPLLYEKLKNRENSKPAHQQTRYKLLIGDWTHGDFGSQLPKDGIPTLDEIALGWFDHYLKGMNVDLDRIPDVTQFVRGKGVYQVQPGWPHAQAEAKRFYLREGNVLSSDRPETMEKSDQMIQHPFNGICSGSTNQWVMGLIRVTPCVNDNRLTEVTEITYTTPVLEKDLRISGPIGAEVHVSTSAKDAVVVVRVTDVAPDGTSTELSNGTLAASLRALDYSEGDNESIKKSKSRFLNGDNIQPWHPFTPESVLPVVSGEVMKLNIEIFPTNAVIKKGHKLRVTVGPSDFPHAVSPIPMQRNQLGGVVNIIHDKEHPSFVSIPVVK